MAIDLHLDADGIATITMNRPERLNALNLEHYQALSDAWMRVRDDARVRVADDAKEGSAAFSEKRAPNFKGA